MKYSCSLLIILIFFLSVSKTAFPEGADSSLTLSKAVSRALEEYPAIRASRASHQEAEATLGINSATYLPLVKLNASATQFEKPMIVTPLHSFGLSQVPQFDQTLYQGGLMVNYLLFDGGVRNARVQQARAQLDSADTDLSVVIQDVIARVVSTYLAILTNQKILEGHNQRINALKAELSRVQQFYKAGRSPRVDILKVQASIANAQADQVKNIEKLNLSNKELSHLLNVSLEEIKYSKLVPVGLSNPFLDPQENLKKEGGQSSLSVKQARHKIEIADAGLGAARGGRWPDLNLVGNYLYFGSSQSEKAVEWQAGAQLSYVLFNGGAIRLEMARAEAVKQNALERLRLAEIQTQQEIDRAVSAIEEAHARVESLETSVERLEEVARIEKLQLETGSVTETDYLNAETDLLVARNNLIETRYSEISAYVELRHVTGHLNLRWLTETVKDLP